jgi:hypothetical protein
MQHTTPDIDEMRTEDHVRGGAAWQRRGRVSARVWRRSLPARPPLLRFAAALHRERSRHRFLRLPAHSLSLHTKRGQSACLSPPLLQPLSSRALASCSTHSACPCFRLTHARPASLAGQVRAAPSGAVRVPCPTYPMYSTHTTHNSRACARFAESLDPPTCGAAPAGARYALLYLSHCGCVLIHVICG